MTDPRGALKVQAGGEEYTLHLGMSVLADLQSKHGSRVLEMLEPPENAGPNWLPPLWVIVDLLLGALCRHHGEVADKYLVDDIIAENPNVFADLMVRAFPDQKPAGGNGKRPKRAA